MKIDFYLKNLQLETINKHIFRFTKIENKITKTVKL